MTGVALNIITVIIGSLIGLLFGRLIKERFREITFFAIGSCTIGFGAITLIAGYNQLSTSQIGSFTALVPVISLVVGSLIGEWLKIEYRLEQVGNFFHKLINKRQPAQSSSISKPSNSQTFTEGFMTASIFFCVGAMTFLGSIQAGLGDSSTLYLKSLLDGISAIALTCALGYGVGFSALTVAVIEGSIALCASLLGDAFTDEIIGSLNITGGIMLLALGLEIIGIKKLRVANMLPALLIAILIALIFSN